ncbi:MAG: carbohydrate-binding family 9-like protein [Candidatus Hinthialibacter antarcticus]|nr:carbohydrate-binding family 9-like protein [Candidatus Hinthialibacter antarcticus]
MNEMPRLHYICYQAGSEITIDGKLDDPAWQRTEWTEYHVDIEGDRKPEPLHPTRSKMLWDENYLYIAAELTEPHVWGTLTERDSVIFNDNDFEIFIDPDADSHNYFEIEINALNTVWDLILIKPYKDGGPAENDWDIDGLLHDVSVEGTLNDPGDEDTSWTVEMAFPWSGFTYTGVQTPAPKAGDQWRINFSRVEWKHTIEDGFYQKVPKRREDNWIWSPQGIVDMHRPEKWGVLQFSDAAPGAGAFKPDKSMTARRVLNDLYYQQRDFRESNRMWSDTTASFELKWGDDANLLGAPMIMLNPDGYEAWVYMKRSDGVYGKAMIRQDAKISVKWNE